MIIESVRRNISDMLFLLGQSTLGRQDGTAAANVCMREAYALRLNACARARASHRRAQHAQTQTQGRTGETMCRLLVE